MNQKTEELEQLKQKIERILQRELPDVPSGEWLEENFGALDCVEQTHVCALLEPTCALVRQGGKRWRPLLLVLCAKMATLDERNIENAFRLTPLLEFVHTASLIHDDIEDSSPERRGKPCAYISYGIDVAINAASWLYFKAASCINSIEADDAHKKRFYDLYAEELRRLHLGQAMDIAWHKKIDLFPSVREYSQMVRCKTGTLSCLASKIGFLAGGAQEHDVEQAGTIAAHIGEGFQILDDVQNLTSGNPGKKRGDDIVEGKKSLPVLLCVERFPERKNTFSSLFKRAKAEGIESPAVEEAIHILEDSGMIEKARDYGSKIIHEKTLALTSILSDNKNGARELIAPLFESILRQEPNSKAEA